MWFEPSAGYRDDSEVQLYAARYAVALSRQNDARHRLHLAGADWRDGDVERGSPPDDGDGAVRLVEAYEVAKRETRDAWTRFNSARERARVLTGVRATERWER